MSKNNNQSIEKVTSAQFKQESYNAYIVYVRLIEGTIKIADAVDAMAPIMAKYGFTLTAENIVGVMTYKMNAFVKVGDEHVRKVKSISTFRAFIKGGWRDVVDTKVVDNAGKDPSAKAAKTEKAEKPKKATKAELEETVKALMAQIADMSKTA